MYFIKTPRLLKRMFPQQVWSIDTRDKKLYLTFDDGPTPEITDWVLETLDQFHARATFFLIGKNVEQNPAMVERILARGHSIGNHTHNHMNGWESSNSAYLRNTLKTEKLLETNLFRPPYGRIKRSQTKAMSHRFRIIMWDVLSGDFDLQAKKEKVVRNVTEHAEPGSIIVFHDSVKAKPRLQYALPRVLEYFSQQGYSFEPIAMA